MRKKDHKEWAALFKQKKETSHRQNPNQYSTFPTIRELENEIKTWMSLTLIHLDDWPIETFKTYLDKLLQTGSYFEQIYLFGFYMDELYNPETISYKDFKAFLETKGHELLKAHDDSPFSFSLQRLKTIISDFVEKLKNLAGTVIPKSLKEKIFRDLNSTINLASHDFLDEGVAQKLQVLHPNKTILVTKQVFPGACKHCQTFYLDPKGESRTFTLSELISNGSNMNRPTKDWKPVVGATHFNCRCLLRFKSAL